MKIILSAALAALLLIGCGSDESTSSKEEIQKSVQKVTQVVKEESVNIAKNVEKATSETVENTKQEIEKTTKTVVQESKEVVLKGVKSVEKALEEPKEVVAEVPKQTVQKIDAAKLFTKCVSCHGQNAEKKALNKSKVIKGWAAKDTIAAINGYKDGSYGSTMKGVMKPQVAKLTEAEVKALSEYISKL